VCAFACRAECAEFCCGGATLITIDEIRRCYDLFPISVGFRKHTPLDALHRDLLDAVGVPWSGRFIVGDFIAGNRHIARCLALNDGNLCSLHGTEKKPAQCRLVPFSALYPKERQDVLFEAQRKGKFARCRGFVDPESAKDIVWREGSFVDQAYRRAYYDFQRGALKQAPLMRRILEGMRGQEAYAQLLGGEGILEVAIPASFLPQVLDEAGLLPEEHQNCVEAQWRLCRRESVRAEGRNPVLEDCIAELERYGVACASHAGESASSEHAPAGGSQGNG
jgi:Fe-S-cluster containining protein